MSLAFPYLYSKVIYSFSYFNFHSMNTNNFIRGTRKHLSSPFLKNLMLSGVSPSFIQQVDAIITLNLDNPNFGVAELAAQLFMTRVHLFRKLKELTGKAPTTYIREFRLAIGMELLLTTDKPIKQIAYEIGFKDPAHFSKAFKELYGMSPREARK